MSLSDKNLNKLNKFIKNKNLIDDSYNICDSKKIDNYDNLNKNPQKSEDPNKIFYSLIDNSESLEETTKVNPSLKNSEINHTSMNSRNTDFSKQLTTEDELYDEFNYLLDE